MIKCIYDKSNLKTYRCVRNVFISPSNGNHFLVSPFSMHIHLLCIGINTKYINRYRYFNIIEITFYIQFFISFKNLQLLILTTHNICSLSCAFPCFT